MIRMGSSHVAVLLLLFHQGVLFVLCRVTLIHDIILGFSQTGLGGQMCQLSGTGDPERAGGPGVGRLGPELTHAEMPITEALDWG